MKLRTTSGHREVVHEFVRSLAVPRPRIVLGPVDGRMLVKCRSTFYIFFIIVSALKDFKSPKCLSNELKIFPNLWEFPALF